MKRILSMNIIASIYDALVALLIGFDDEFFTDVKFSMAMVIINTLVLSTSFPFILQVAVG